MTNGHRVREIIDLKSRWARSSEGILARALIKSAHNHHQLARIDGGSTEHQLEQHWQYCQAYSCTMAMRAMVEANVPGYRAKVQIRKRRIEQQRKRLAKMKI